MCQELGSSELKCVFTSAYRVFAFNLACRALELGI
jgi:hypothetical protein